MHVIAHIHIESLLPLDDNDICTGVLCIFWESYSLTMHVIAHIHIESLLPLDDNDICTGGFVYILGIILINNACYCTYTHRKLVTTG